MEEQVVNATTLVVRRNIFRLKAVDERFFDEKSSANSSFDGKSFDQRHPTRFQQPCIYNLRNSNEKRYEMYQ